MSKREMILRHSEWIEQHICFAFESARVSWNPQNCQVRRREFLMRVRSQRALMRNLISPQEMCSLPFDVKTSDQTIDSGSVVSKCPVDHATSVPTEKVHYRMNLECVLGESLQHYGIKRNVLFTSRTGSTMNVNYGVTETKRAILSVHKGCGNGSMIVFTPDGRGKIVNDTKCIDQVKTDHGAHIRIRHCE